MGGIADNDHIGTIGEARSATGRENGITALRLILAMVVLFAHAWPSGGFGRDPIDALTGGRLGGAGVLAVAGFFGLSGYLLADSRRRHSAPGFLWRRVVRIFPAYGLVVAATALIVGPWYVASAWFPIPGVGGVTWEGWGAHPLPLVNASLWTLWPELCCYLLLAAIPGRLLPKVLPVVAMLVVLMAWLVPQLALAATIVLGPTVAFLVGASLSVWRDRIPLSGALAAGGIPLAFAALGSSGGLIVCQAIFAYSTVVFGVRLPLHWRVDVSYGAYLFAFPVTQYLVGLGAAALGPWPLAMTAAACTLPIAAASWHLVERPLLGWRVSWPHEPSLQVPVTEVEMAAHHH